MKKTIAITLFVALMSLGIEAQIVLDINAEGFFHDAEYSTGLAKGYTVTGSRLSPSLVFDIHGRGELRVGMNATLFAGLDSLYSLRPALTLVYRPAGWLSFVAGTLIDDNHHQLSAPVVDPSRHIFNYQEDGIQILTNTAIWQSDTWLDWTHYLVPWTPDQELFTMGSRHSLVLLHPSLPHSHQLIVSLPAHFIASHRGGEVKTIDTNTVTTFNEKIGLRLSCSATHSEKNESTLFIDLPLFLYHLEDTELDHGGYAFYPSLSLLFAHKANESTVKINNCLGFWYGDHYFSAYGSPLFWSSNAYSLQHVPPSSSPAVDDVRSILSYTFSIEHGFRNNISAGLKVDALHDLDINKNDFIFSFFLIYNGQFRLK